MKNFSQSTFLIFFVLFLNSTAQSQSVVSITRVTDNPSLYKKTEFDIAIASTYVNPFDQNDITVDLVFTDPDGANVMLPCYFLNGNSTSSHWKARFAPRKTGAYNVQVVLKKNSTQVATLDGQEFIVGNNADNGFLHVKDNWILQYDNGKPFRGIGENFGWEPTTLEGKHTYDYLLPHLQKYGLNFFRTWMCNWNLPLEWKTVASPRYTNAGDYFNPSGVKRMDELVDMIDSLELKIMLTFDYHGALMTNTAWAQNNYNKVNGGPCSTPSEFFSLPAAKAMYKNRLRYIVARWGYSTGIAVWEFFNEVDNAMYDGETIIIPHNIVTQWHTEMSTYLKSIDPYDHVVSTSISHRPITGLFSVPDIDINQQHIYKATGNIPSALSGNSTGKPFVIGEFAYEWDWNVDFSTIASELDFDYKRGLWYGLFNPTPILPMSWWWEFFHDRGSDTYIKGVRELEDNMLLAGGGTFNKMMTTSPGAGIEVYALKCGEKYFVYAVNTTTSSATNKTIGFAVSADNTYDVKNFNPETLIYQDNGNVTSSSKMIQFSSLSFSSRESKIFIVSLPGNADGIQTSFYDQPLSVPGKIEAEDFDRGGEGISYHDFETANLGGAYRASDGVDISAVVPSGFQVTNIVRGEWIEYSVEVQTRATYSLSLNVASSTNNNTLHIELNGKNISGEITVPNTGSLGDWTSVVLTTPILDTGTQVMRVVFTSSDISLDNITYAVNNEAPVVVVSSPVEGTVIALPSTVDFVVSASDDDGSISLVEFFDGDQKIGEDNSAPYSFSWNAPVGDHQVSIVATDNKGLQTANTVAIKVKPSNIQAPFHGTPFSVPGKIEAEDLDMGASNVACFDLTAGNIKGAYRTDTDADIEVCMDDGGGYNLADIQNTEWVEYTADVAEAGKYDFSYRVATQMASQKFRLYINGISLGVVNVPNTGAWQTWQTVQQPRIALPSGTVTIKLGFESGYFNLNYFTIDKSIITADECSATNEMVLSPNPSHEDFHLTSDHPVCVQVLDITGRRVFSSDTFVTSITFGNNFSPGVYLVQLTKGSGDTRVVRVVRK